MVTLEQLLDKIADELILDETGIITPSIVKQNQKTISDGLIKIGRTDSDRLVLYQKDVEANKNDLLYTVTNDAGETIPKLESIASQLNDINSVTVEIYGSQETGYTITLKESGIFIADLTNVIFNQILETDNLVTTNPLNVSQFVTLEQSASFVDVDKAEEFLDTNIFELLPTGDTRQARIIRFFQELNALLPPNPPEFDLDGDGSVDREEGTNNWTGSLQYSQDNSISYAQDNQDGNIDEEEAFIHRLKFGSVPANSTNSSRTIEDIYRTIEPYLKDILEDPTTPQDDRRTYVNQSNGYLQFRDLNQGIIIRNTNQDFIEGLDPSNPTYLETGFTITMWVRFLDKVSEGTLFNFGNPTRGYNGGPYPGYVDDSAFGFRLETFVLNKDDETLHVASNNTWGDVASGITNYNSANAFDNSNTARFVRLIINDNGQLRDSTVGFEATDNQGQKLNNTIPFKPEVTQFGTEYTLRLFGSTFIPEDFNEWYFICATYNPDVNEDNSHDGGNYVGQDHTAHEGNFILEKTPDYWLNHIESDGTTYTSKSNKGNKCKVEIISKSDLLRARGFKV